MNNINITQPNVLVESHVQFSCPSASLCSVVVRLTCVLLIACQWSQYCCCVHLSRLVWYLSPCHLFSQGQSLFDVSYFLWHVSWFMLLLILMIIE